MNYDNPSFFRLMDDAADQDAEHLDRVCTFRRYELTGDKEVASNGPLPGCEQSALFSVPYQDGDDDVLSSVTVCAVDDAMGAWPRFGGDKLAKLSTRDLFFIHGDRLTKDDPRVTSR